MCTYIKMSPSTPINVYSYKSIQNKKYFEKNSFQREAGLRAQCDLQVEMSSRKLLS
jgi:hypothetical protein